MQIYWKYYAKFLFLYYFGSQKLYVCLPHAYSHLKLCNWDDVWSFFQYQLIIRKNYLPAWHDLTTKDRLSCVFLLIHVPCFFPSLQTTSSALKGAIQLGITHTVGSLSQKPERDVLLQDFEVVESIFFPRWVFKVMKWRWLNVSFLH